MGNLNKVPTIRFPKFKDAWQHKKLSEFLKEAKKRNGDLKYDKGEVLSVSGELGIVNQIEHLGRSYAGVSVHQYHVVEVGDIVYTKSPLKANPFGIIRLNKAKAGIVSTLYAVYNVKEKNAYGPFLDYYFSLDANTNRYLRPLVKKGAKNDMKINNAFVLHDPIYAPSIPEQKRIAAFFTVLDKKITQLKEKKALLEQYKKGVMQKLFAAPHCPNHGSGGLKDFTKPDAQKKSVPSSNPCCLRFRQENGKEFPKWEKKKLGEVAEFSKGKGISKNQIIESGLYQCIRYGELYTHYGETISEIKSRTNLTPNELIFSEINDVIIPASGESQIDIAKASCVLKKGIALGGDINIIRSELSGVYLSYYLNHFKRNDIARLAQGVSVVHLYSSQLSSLVVDIPNYDEQMCIASFISSIEKKITRTETQIQQTQEYKKGLLQQMFCNG